MDKLDTHFQPPPKAIVKLVDEMFKSASKAILLDGEFKYQAPRGGPSKVAVYEIFSGDFKGKLASWRNATKRQGSSLNQYYRTEELIAIFSGDKSRLISATKTVIQPSREEDYDELYQYLKTNHSSEINNTVVGLNAYRSNLVESYSQSKIDILRKDGGEAKSSTTTIGGSSGEPSREFGASVLMYTRYLRSTRRHHMVVELRNKLTHLFHLLGLNAQREEMGRLALESSTVLKDSASRAETLIDDLGWAVHLQGRTEEAEENINSAIRMLEKEKANRLDEKIRNYRARSKAHRHLAFLASTPSLRRFHLQECKDAIDALKGDEEAMNLHRAGIVCDEAQLHHAQAYLSARDLGVQQEGVLPEDDQHARRIATEALDTVQQAVNLFEEIGDLERQVKALLLVERLNNALGHKLEEIEARALKEEVLSQSGIDGGMTAITLQRPVTV